MKKSSREALDAYYREAGSWAADQIGTLRLSRRVAWIVAAVAAVIAIVEGLALIVLMPLKTTVPYTLMVDRTTGFVQALKPLDPAQITPDRALVQSMLVQYVIAREGFDMGSLQADYGKVRPVVGRYGAHGVSGADAGVEHQQPIEPLSGINPSRNPCEERVALELLLGPGAVRNH